MWQSSFLRVATAVPALKIADCTHNAERILATLDRAQADVVNLVVFPELTLTGYTCADLFHQSTLLEGAKQSLLDLVKHSRFPGWYLLGLPIAIDGQLFNCAAVCHRDEILGVVPKSIIPNYGEFYEARWFAPAHVARSRFVRIGKHDVPFGTDLLFEAPERGLKLGVELCEDLWAPIPPSSFQVLAGANVIANLSASNEIIGKAAYRKQLVVNQSGRGIAGYLYCSSGVRESTTDVVFGGHCLIAENGTLLAESARFDRAEAYVVTDLDLERVQTDRLRSNSFGQNRVVTRLPEYRVIDAPLRSRELGRLRRPIDAHPFVPRGQQQLRERCEEIFHTQVSALATRLEHIGKPPVTIGISGGLDSTLSLLVTCKTLDLLGVPRDRIQAVTMPGFGTTDRTKENASTLMRELGVTSSVVDIRTLCVEQMKSLDHRPFGITLDGLTLDDLATQFRRVPKEKRHDLVFENVQARMRTSILMNKGFVIGTGDLSEMALGWCTYNGDHMSMYNPNTGIPKTLVKFLVRWAAENEFDGETRRVLLDIVDTEISPELLPPSEDGQRQSTESTVGPYELHDFFLYHMLRFGSSPSKILYLAGHADFENRYDENEVKRWLGVFLRRFFGNQFKRSCVPDGPKVGSISLSPRGDWRMPSDAQVRLWLEELDSDSALRHAA